MPDYPSNGPAPAQPARGNPLVEILINILIPTLVLSFFSKEAWLGPKLALIVALAFPIGYGIKDLLGAHKVNIFSVLGVVTVALTGGMGLLEIDPKYIAIKEAAIPAVLGLFTLISLKTRRPLVRTVIYNERILQVDRIASVLREKGTAGEFEKSLTNASFLLAGSFFLSATTNYILAKVVLVSPPGTEAFNEDLARMIALSYPVNVLPAMIVMIITLVYTYRSIRRHTGLSLEEILADPT